jgi:hypothetical protein
LTGFAASVLQKETNKESMIGNYRRKTLLPWEFPYLSEGHSLGGEGLKIRGGLWTQLSFPGVKHEAF